MLTSAKGRSKHAEAQMCDS